jgi:protein phosphatase
MKICLKALTHVGKVRANNEDTFSVCADLAAADWAPTDGYIPLGPSGSLVIVADGMGGAKAGEVASTLAVECIRRHFEDHPLPLDGTGEEKCAFLKAAISEAASRLMERVESDPETIGMGTTVVLLWLIGGKAHIAWCGDSRGYVFHPERGLRALTKDHSYVQELVDQGKITPEEAFDHPDSNLITKGLGDIDADASADSLIYDVTEGDVFLLCSDGLCGYCRDALVEDILYARLCDLDACRDQLLEAALQAGGHDNITIALLATLPDKADKPHIRLATRIRRKLFPGR